MYIWAQKGNAFYNSNNVKTIWIGEAEKNFTLWADNYVIGNYSNYDDAKKVLEEIFRMLECGSTSYQIN